MPAPPSRNVSLWQSWSQTGFGTCFPMSVAATLLSWEIFWKGGMPHSASSRPCVPGWLCYHGLRDTGGTSAGWLLVPVLGTVRGSHVSKAVVHTDPYPSCSPTCACALISKLRVRQQLQQQLCLPPGLSTGELPFWVLLLGSAMDCIV